MGFAVAIAIIASLTLTSLVRRIALRHGAVSQPDGNRKLHARPTPLGGGVAVYLALIFGVSGWYALTQSNTEGMWLPLALGLSAGLICLLGCFDDLYDIPASWKLAGQIVSTLPVLLAGCYVERLVVFGFCVNVGYWGIVGTIGWLVLGVNSLNLVDGVDGLASVIGISISLCVAVIAAGLGLHQVMVLSLVLAGGLTGFLVHNLPPAVIYLGDCGSMLIGLILSFLTLQVALEAPMTANLSVAAILLFVPLLDTALAIVRRTLSGRSFMAADRGHVHHRLLDRGFSIWKVLVFLAVFCLITGANAWYITVAGHELWAWIALGSMAIVLVKVQLVGHKEWELTKRLLVESALPVVQRLLPTGLPSRGRDATPPVIAGSTERTVDEQPEYGPDSSEPAWQKRRAA